MIRYEPSPAQSALPSATCRMALIGRMADDMREIAFDGQGVSAETLVQRGWTLPTVKRFSGEAIAQARRQSVRRLGR
ncbi:MAG: hypothetical protein ACSHXI_07140 [Hoeflea sp.]|uniref:hypothetical protein n=1 Tax=Hoeflea sp. TaxID=1940281 RepID=UPI003EF2332B